MYSLLFFVLFYTRLYSPTHVHTQQVAAAYYTVEAIKLFQSDEDNQELSGLP